jgi:glycosyltransferase involved in cell wall biosynthesis
MSISTHEKSSDGSSVELIVIPTLRARFLANGMVRTTAKFIEGMRMYAQLWPGPVSALLRHSDAADSNLDPVIVDPADLPFGLFRVDLADERAVARAILDSAAVLASLDCDQTGMSRICRRLDIPCVYATEYTLATRRQIIAATTRNPLRRVRRELWTRRLERKQLAALRLASGVQCNGTPTYNAYRHITPSPLLYFDTRVSEDMLISSAALEDRLDELGYRPDLRLAFSGRLVRMKGAHHLPTLARELRRLNIRITLDIYGDGDCREELRQRIDKLQLGDFVRLRGVVDFSSELIPTLSRETDLMVLPHPQGDPSCTYLETLATGVPIVAYNNEAWSGILDDANLRRLSIGRAATLGDPRALAREIAHYAHHRDELAAASRDARSFAAAHTFEATFRCRVEHLLSLSRFTRSRGTTPLSA